MRWMRIGPVLQGTALHSSPLLSNRIESKRRKKGEVDLENLHGGWAKDIYM
jgi:hypothetical protein